MCGRFTLKTSRDRIKEMFRLQRIGEFDPRYNIAPSQQVLAARVDAESGDREAVMLKWGLIPVWAKDAKIGNSLANARADTIATKPAFRSAFKQRRCLVIADGFYEWGKEDGGKNPLLFSNERWQPIRLRWAVGALGQGRRTD
jgi:putative SOS response-associated peptidase YedK